MNDSTKLGVEVKSGDRVIKVAPDQIQAVLSDMINIESVTVSISLVRKTSNNNSNNYFQSMGLTVGDAWNTSVEGMTTQEVRGAITKVIASKVEAMYRFIRSSIKKQQEIDGIPVFNLGEMVDNAK